MEWSVHGLAALGGVAPSGGTGKGMHYEYWVGGEPGLSIAVAPSPIAESGS